MSDFGSPIAPLYGPQERRFRVPGSGLRVWFCWVRKMSPNFESQTHELARKCLGFGRICEGTAFARALFMEHAIAAPSQGHLRKLRLPSMGRIEEVNKELWLLLSIF